MSVTLPTIPPLPQGATHDQQMRHFEAQMRVIEFNRREAHEAAAEARSRAYVEVTQKLADAQGRAAAAMERTLADGIPTDQPMVDAINALREAIAGAAQPPEAPAPTPVGDEPALVALVSTMTSNQRLNPAAAASAAKAQLAAIRGA
jgi:hypothetical protein